MVAETDTAEKGWRGAASVYGKLVPPDQPSVGDVRTYGKQIALVLNNKPEAKILILGSTPHLRDLVRDMSLGSELEVRCLDLTPRMYEAMSQLVWKRNEREKFVEGSWLEMPFSENSFDLVLGDLVICQFERSEHKKLFQEVSRVMSAEGSWITRHNYFAKETSEEALVDFLVQGSQSILHGSLATRQLATNSVHLVIYALAFSNAGRVNLGEALDYYQKLTELAAEQVSEKHKMVLRDSCHFYINLFKGSSDLTWTCLSEADSEKELKDSFKIEAKEFAEDHVTAELTPVYRLISH